jgi:hypothetical protein
LIFLAARIAPNPTPAPNMTNKSSRYIAAFVTWMLLCGVTACTTDKNIPFVNDRMEIERKVLIDFLTPTFSKCSKELILIKASKPVEDNIISTYGAKYRIKHYSDGIAHGEPAVIFFIDDVKISGDYAEVDAFYPVHGILYKLKKENGKWVIISDELTWQA